MKTRSFLFALVLITLTSVANLSYAQSDTTGAIAPTYKQALEEEVEAKEAVAKAASRHNRNRQKDADAMRKEYRMKAKEASRINDDAADAAKQAKRSARMERKAQIARGRAEKQRGKANRAARKSDSN